MALCRGQPLRSAGWALGRCLALLLKERPLPREEERVLCAADVLAANCQPGAAQPSWRGFHALTSQLPQVGVGGEGDPLRFPAPRVPAALFQLQLSALLVGQLADRWLFWSLGSLGQLFLPVIMPNSFLSALLASGFVLLAPFLPCLPTCPCPSPLLGSGRRPSFWLAAFLSIQLPPTECSRRHGADWIHAPCPELARVQVGIARSGPGPAPYALVFCTLPPALSSARQSWLLSQLCLSDATSAPQDLGEDSQSKERCLCPLSPLQPSTVPEPDVPWS